MMPACVAIMLSVGESVRSLGLGLLGAHAAMAPVRSRELSRYRPGDLDVGRLEMTMNDALLVRCLERVGDLACDLERLLRVAASQNS